MVQLIAPGFGNQGDREDRGREEIGNGALCPHALRKL